MFMFVFVCRMYHVRGCQFRVRPAARRDAQVSALPIALFSTTAVGARGRSAQTQHGGRVSRSGSLTLITLSRV